jgi:DNA replication and repair protein RecF
LDPQFNLICGKNASGKTSALEALAYLGRGRSFRGASIDSLLKHGEKEFILYGETVSAGRRTSIGVKNGINGLETRISGKNGDGINSLIELLPLQIIDPEIHSLISGGPERRRQYIDWVAFHVEQGYLSIWRKYKRTLKQRNAALKSKSRASVVHGWNKDFIELANSINESRKNALSLITDNLKNLGHQLIGVEFSFEYQKGWSSKKNLELALSDSFDRDLLFGATQLGPHRADLKVSCSEQQARKLISRGQQKLLASTMVLAATNTVQSILEKPLLLLLDDPAAELDFESVSKLLKCVSSLNCQVVATSIDQEIGRFFEVPRMFHVEQGVISECN